MSSGRTRLVPDGARPVHLGAALVAVLVLIAFAPAAAGASSTPAGTTIVLDNRISVDGAKVDPRLDPVIIHHAGKTYAVRASSPDTADAIRKMKPEEALKAIIVFNRDLETRISLDPK